MTASSETAPGKFGHYISGTRIKPSARSREFERDALIDTYGCMLTGDLTITDIETESRLREDVTQMIAKTSVKGFKPKRPERNYDPEQPDRIVIESSEGSQLVEIPYPLGSPQKPMPKTQHFHKFQLNARLGDAAAQHLWDQLRAWPQAENIHALLTPLPVTFNEENLHK